MLQFVQALVHQGYEVLATCRQSSDALEAVARVVVIPGKCLPGNRMICRSYPLTLPQCCADVDVTSDQGLQPLHHAVQARKVRTSAAAKYLMAAW